MSIWVMYSAETIVVENNIALKRFDFEKVLGSLNRKIEFAWYGRAVKYFFLVDIQDDKENIVSCLLRSFSAYLRDATN